MRLEEKLSHLETVLDKAAFKLLVEFTNSLSKRQTSTLLRSIIKNVGCFEVMLKSKDAKSIYKSIDNLFSSLVHCYSFSTVRSIHSHTRGLITYYHVNGYFKVAFTPEVKSLLENHLSKSQFEQYKQQTSLSSRINNPGLWSPTPRITKNVQFSPEVQERLNHLRAYLNTDAFSMLHDYLSISDNTRRTRLTHILVTYLEVIKESLNTRNEAELVEALTNMRTHICHHCTYKSSRAKFTHIRMFIRHMKEVGYLQGNTTEQLTKLLKSIDLESYQSSKLDDLPDKFIEKTQKSLSADEVFLNTLNSTCPSKIAKRLLEHVNSFKHKKQHRAPLNGFLNQIFSSDPEWYTKPNIIQGELIKYRGNLLDSFQRNSAYGQFQNVKNAVGLLVSHGLLPSDTNLPDNLRRCVNTEKVRDSNPLISSTDVYDENKRKTYVDSPTFIQDLKNELSANLLLLKRKAQEIVFAGYHQFLAKESMIKMSQFDEYNASPKLLVKNNASSGRITRKLVNPFSTIQPLRLANLTAYYDYHFESLIKGKTPHKMRELCICNEILGYLGLTPSVASAMQMIITEEVGINPYSLYDAKVQSEGHGQEFVQVNDSGSVRIKTLKLRARTTQTRKLNGTETPLSDISSGNIDAAVCLKMALELTARSRNALGVNQLWTCLSVKGATIGSADTFQTSFKQYRDDLGKENPVLSKATLKKVRTTKGVLIYLSSNGNSLETAKYLGNTVKTTLHRYVPQYLTELIYRTKVRNFQDVLLFMTISQEGGLHTNLKLSESELKAKLTQAFNNPDMGGNLYDAFSKSPKNIRTNNELYFCVSEQNIQLAINYARVGDNDKLRENCEAVLNKIAQGPIVMKQLLRKAQVNLNKG